MRSLTNREEILLFQLKFMTNSVIIKKQKSDKASVLYFFSTIGIGSFVKNTVNLLPFGLNKRFLFIYFFKLYNSRHLIEDFYEINLFYII